MYFPIANIGIVIIIRISKRRLMYLWNILKQNENELIRKVFNVQKLVQTKGDWFQMINNERKVMEKSPKWANTDSNELLIRKSTVLPFCTWKRKHLHMKSHSKFSRLLKHNPVRKGSLTWKEICSTNQTVSCCLNFVQKC